MTTSEPHCNHDVAAWSRGKCECGSAVLTDEQVRQLMVLRDRYLAEPDPEDDERDDGCVRCGYRP